MSSVDQSKVSSHRTSRSNTSSADNSSPFLQVPAFASSSILNPASRRRRRSSNHPHLRVTANNASCDSLVASSSTTRLPDTHEPRKLDWKLEQPSNSSTTLLSSRSVSPAISLFQSSSDFQYTSTDSAARAPYVQTRESTHLFAYPLHQPGERIAKRTQILRSRIAIIIQSLPATVDDVVDTLGPSPPNTPPPKRAECHGDPLIGRSSVDSCKKLRRVSGCVNLRDNFRQSISLQRDTPDKPVAAQVKCQLLALPCPRPGALGLSSVDTLVEPSTPPFPTKQQSKEKVVHSTILYSPTTPSKPFSTPSSLPSTLPASRDLRKRMVAHPHSPSPSSYHRNGPKEQSSCRETCDEFGLVYIGGPVWSCAKITRSAAKRAARRAPPKTPKKNGFMPYPSILAFAHSLST
ncbi:hypothetical protein V8B97DRAFT_1712768 [Scleroderma yunnanense]